MTIKRENIRIQVVITKKLYAKLKEKSEYEDRSISNLSGKIINDYFKDELEVEE